MTKQCNINLAFHFKKVMKMMRKNSTRFDDGKEMFYSSLWKTLYSSSTMVNLTTLITFYLTGMITVILQNLRYDYINGYRVPVFFFKDLPSFFYPFIICCMMALSTSVSALCLQHKVPWLAQFFRLYAVLSITMAAIILLSSIYVSVFYSLFITTNSNFTPALYIADIIPGVELLKKKMVPI
jgi:hypothetical protein